LTSKLERTTLQLEGAQTKNSDLKRANEDLKRNNSEIQRQLTKWQNLETKGDMEVETLRKRRIELEVEVKELEKRLEKSEKYAKDNAAALEKEHRRLEKTQIGITDWQVLRPFERDNQTVDELTSNAGESGEAWRGSGGSSEEI
jgi:predicted  nucleic acid-binding Zn-ribbon protein